MMARSRWPAARPKSYFLFFVFSKAEEVRRKVTGNMLVQVYKQRVREGPAAASKKLQATSIAARSMLEEENEFLLRDLRSVEEPYGTDILTLTVACGYRDRLLKNTKIERYLARHHIDILHALQKLLSENGLKHTASENGKS